jgi:hypothetical protein
MNLTKSHSKSINGVLPPLALGTGTTMIKKLLTTKFTKGLGGGGVEEGRGGGVGGLFG